MLIFPLGGVFQIVMEWVNMMQYMLCTSLHYQYNYFPLPTDSVHDNFTVIVSVDGKVAAIFKIGRHGRQGATARCPNIQICS
jgi:hypothetical protein